MGEKAKQFTTKGGLERLTNQLLVAAPVELVATSHSDYYITFLVSLVYIPVSVGHLFQRVGSVDHCSKLACFN